MQNMAFKKVHFDPTPHTSIVLYNTKSSSFLLYAASFSLSFVAWTSFSTESVLGTYFFFLIKRITEFSCYFGGKSTGWVFLFGGCYSLKRFF